MESHTNIHVCVTHSEFRSTGVATSYGEVCCRPVDIFTEGDAQCLVFLGDHSGPYEGAGCKLCGGNGPVEKQFRQIEEHGCSLQRDGVVAASCINLEMCTGE